MTTRFCTYGFLIMILVATTGCLNDSLYEEIEYSEISREVGPEGGTITFYSEALPHDKPFQSRVEAVLEVPEGAFDEEVILNLEEVGEFEELLWHFTPDVDFQKPVRLSYRTVRLDSNFVDAYCYYGPFRESGTGERVGIGEYEYDHSTNMVSYYVDELAGNYTYLPTMEFNQSLFANSHFFCQSSNEEIIEIDLLDDSDVAINNLLIIPKHAITPPAYIDISREMEFEAVENVFGARNHQEILMGDVYLLPVRYGELYKINPVDLNLSQNADLYLELSRGFPFNSDEKLPYMNIYRIDTQTETITEAYPVEKIQNITANIFKTQINQGGVYALGIPEEHFSMWKGGTIQVTDTDPSSDLSLTYESTDYGGADIFCVSDPEGCLMTVHLNQRDGEKENAADYAFLDFYYDQELDYLELDFFESNVLHYTDNSVPRYFLFDPLSVRNYTIDKLEVHMGGIIAGSFEADATDESGTLHTLRIDFEIKVVTVDSVTL